MALYGLSGESWSLAQEKITLTAEGLDSLTELKSSL